MVTRSRPTNKTAKKATKTKKAKTQDSGKDRRQEILQSAREVLISYGYHSFSMRRVATTAGIHLKTLQHYFETKQELLVETLNYTLDKHYFGQYLRLFKDAVDDSSKQALSNVISYLISDCTTEDTSKFFSEMWALSFRDQDARAALDSFYISHRNQLEMLMIRANPKMSRETAKLRAAVIAAQIEGLVVLIGHNKPRHSEFENLQQETHDRIMEYVFAKEQ